MTDPNSIEARFVAYLSLLSKDQRLAAIRRVGVCPRCGEMATGHRCEVVAEGLDEVLEYPGTRKRTTAQ